MRKTDKKFIKENRIKVINLKPCLLALVIVAALTWWLTTIFKYELFSKEVAQQAIQTGSVRVDYGLLDSPVLTKIILQAEVVKPNIDSGTRDSQGFLTKIEKSLDDNFDWQINLPKPHYNQNMVYIHSDYWNYDGVVSLDPIPNGVKLFRNRRLSWETARQVDGHIYCVPSQVDLTDTDNAIRVIMPVLLVLLGRFLLLWFAVRILIEISIPTVRRFGRSFSMIKVRAGLLERDIEDSLLIAHQSRLDQITVIYLFGDRGILFYT